MCKVDVNQKTNKRTAYCSHMIHQGNGEYVRHGKTLAPGEGIFYQKSKTDYGFYCKECFETVHWENNVMAKKQDSNEEKKHCKHGFIMGLEIEENERDSRFSLILLRSHFIKSEDISVENEYISPMLPNANGIGKMLDNLLNQGFYQDSHCGCHLNLSNEIYSLKRFESRIVNNYDEIFRPLYNTMKIHEYDTDRLYGRSLNHYCNHCDPDEKYSFINVLKLDNGVLEFRFPKLRTSKQYMDTMRFCRAIYTELYNGLINNMPYDRIADRLVRIYNEDKDNR